VCLIAVEDEGFESCVLKEHYSNGIKPKLFFSIIQVQQGLFCMG
jgi:hypothetical protein